MATGMYMAGHTKGIYDLGIWRVVTGLGIGGVLAAINAVASEFSNKKRKHLCVSIMAIGYPLGAAMALYIVARSTWRGKRRVEWRGRTYSASVRSGSG
jgi:MFS family permease